MIPFLIAVPEQVERMDVRPLGLPTETLINPMRVGSARFLTRLQAMDRMTFGPEGMPMPRWVFYDCAEIPGGIFGFARRAKDLDPAVTERFGAPFDNDSLVPFSMFVAIPVRPPGVWFGHNLASLNPTFPQLGMRGLGGMTKALGLAAFGCRTQIGATQWDSAALHIHARFGPLDLMTAWTPAHSEPWTLTYRFDITEPKLRSALGDPAATVEFPPEDLEIDASDHAAMQALQARIERGERFRIAGPPRPPTTGGQRVPVARLPNAPGE